MLGSILLTVAMTSQEVRPTLTFSNSAIQSRLGEPFAWALDNLNRNTVPYDPKVYNPTGLLKGGRFLRAGGGYDQPWTRDSAVNSWNAASLFEPSVARDTLLSVTRPDERGEPIVQRDNQWWDKVVWVVGAWSHYRVTGDRAFLTTAYGVSTRLLREMRSTRYVSQVGLFRGPSFFNDGIAGYPAPPAAEDDGGSSFVLDHPGADRVMALSTNCVYVGAFQSASAMARELGQPSGEWDDAAKALKGAIDRRFWLLERGTYGYLVRADGTLDPSQEGCGLAFAVLFDVASPARARAILRTARVAPFGMVDVDPAFPRYSDARPGRHNAIVWPMVQGMWARAAAKAREADSFRVQVDALSRLVSGSDGHFFEIYNAQTGKADGGWQNGRHWDSAPDQTWSATAYLSMVTNGLFGMRFEPKGLRFEPLVPKGWGDATLANVPYRGATLDVALKGDGAKVSGLRLDGKPLRGGLVPGDLTGHHNVEIAVR